MLPYVHPVADDVMQLMRNSAKRSEREMISNRTVARLAWSLCGLSIALGVLRLLILFLNRSNSEVPIDLYWGADTVTAMVYPIVGALIVARQPNNKIGWLFIVLGLSFAVSGFASAYTNYALFVAPGMLPGTAAITWAGLAIGTIAFASIFFLFLLFPNGEFLSRRWRAVAWLLLAAIMLQIVSDAFMPGPFALYPALTNPFGILAASGALKLLSAAASPMFVVAALLSVVSAFVRYRRSRGDERQQLKWFAYAVALVPLSLVGNGIFPSFAWLIGGLGVANIAVGVGIAILRYRLYDIDIIIRRTLVYSLLTLTLGMVYVGCILVSRTLIAQITGSSNLAIIASTLAIAALFLPLRRRIQNTIDKRFYRRKYDAAKVLAAFGATARDETELERLTAEMLRVVDETIQPEFVGLWVREAPARSAPNSISPDST
jgi:hypothetical protein